MTVEKCPECRALLACLQGQSESELLYGASKLASLCMLESRRGRESDMHLQGTPMAIGLILILVTPNIAAQQKQPPPSIEFGQAQISLGLTREQVERGLRESGRHLVDANDGHTALVRINNEPTPIGDEGEVMFFDGHVAYAVFQFPVARNAAELSQEIAGAVENMPTKLCTVRTDTSHGTGGGVSDTAFNCGSKSFHVLTAEVLGSDERDTNVQITIGGIPRVSLHKR